MARIACLSSLAVVVVVVVALGVGSSSGQNVFGDLVNAVGDTFTCGPKINEECGDLKTGDVKDKDEGRAACCHYARLAHCVEGAIEKHCAGTPFSAASKFFTGLPDSKTCEGYTYWSPECLYSNYFLLVIGTSVGLAALVLAICVICCCCCCRK